MDSRKFVLQKAGVIALGQAVCVSAMVGIFALLGQFDMTVLWGGIVGGAMATLNFFFMAMGAMMAADKAMEDNVAGGNATVRLSYILRLAVLAIVLFAFAKSGICNVFALVLPLVFTRPILTVTEFFRKPGEKKQ